MTWTFDHLAFNTADGQTLQDSALEAPHPNPLPEGEGTDRGV
jgi:hypothetical protein